MAARAPYLALFLCLSTGCNHSSPAPAPVPATDPEPPPPTPVTVVHDTVMIRDTALQQQVARLELRLLEKDGQIEALQDRLEAAQQEVVRALARSQTTASRAEAASGMAEAELAMRSPRGTSNGDLGQAKRLMQLGTEAFNQGNYGGALYLSNQAKALVTGSPRTATPDRQTRPGEKSFATPVRLKALSRTNVREGPGPSYKILFNLAPGTEVMGESYTDQWIRVTDAGGRTGWVARALLGRPS